LLLGALTLRLCATDAGAQAPMATDDIEFAAPAVLPVQATVDDLVSTQPTRSPEMSAMERQLGVLQADLAALRQRLYEDERSIERLRSTDLLRAEFRQADARFPKVQLGGVVQADAGWFTQTAGSRATFGNLQDTAGFRRTRLAAFGDVASNVSYLFEMDFAAPGRPSFMDVWLDVHEIPWLGNVRIGQWRQPFHMDVQTSVREITFLESALSLALAPVRQVGIGFHDVNSDQTATWAASVFRYPTDIYGDTGSPEGRGFLGDRGYGGAARVTGLLWHEEAGTVVHVGAGYAYLVPGEGVVNYRTPPEFGGPFVGSTGTLKSVPFFAETLAMPAQYVQLYDAEFGLRFGSWYGQAEATYSMIEEPSGNALSFPGVYGQFAWLVTGEVRPYNRSAGVFGRVKPLRDFGQEGWGAWEVAARYSYLNLNEMVSSGPTKPGGRLADVTLGVNWYMNTYSRIQFNYILAMLDRPAVGDSDTSIFAVRAQFDF